MLRSQKYIDKHNTLNQLINAYRNQDNVKHKHTPTDYELPILEAIRILANRVNSDPHTKKVTLQSKMNK